MTTLRHPITSYLQTAVVPRLWSRSGSRVLLIYGTGLMVVVLSLAIGLLVGGVRLDGPLWQLAILAAVAFVAERQPVRITPNFEITFAVLPTLFAAVVYGPLDAMVVGGLSLLGDFRAPHVRWLIWTATRTLAAGLAGVAVVVLLPVEPAVGELILAVVAASLIDGLVDASLGALTVALRGTGSYGAFVRSVQPLLISSLALNVPAIVVLAYAYGQASEWTVLLFFAPGFAAQSLYRLYRQQRQAAEELAAANIRLQRANLSFATALVATLDARDRYTAGHSAAVAIYARDIAERMGLSEEDRRLAHLCGLVHDIGKIGLSPGLLEKPGALTLDERRQMEEHSAIGERILRNVEDYAEIATIVRHHHERMDGGGYPDGLRWEEIPLVSRIISVADAYNAMTSDRPYRDAMPSRVARLRLAQAVESQFDTNVVAAFEAILAGATEDYRSGLGLSFEVEAEAHPELRGAAASAA
ncbi:MAG TPA: HD domain-containing phosphohydrolase [Gaiellaceae bacterium]|nr:HD domain-containing phosphohydrolase [Gaiellaceae bacterium]